MKNSLILLFFRTVPIMVLAVNLLIPYTLNETTIAQARSSCTHYASPSGGGNGSSQSSPFHVADFWRVAGPGKTLCLLDGTYTGANAMIDPPDNFNGSSGNPITVRALNDGKVFIDGQRRRTPIYLAENDWFVIEGMNACCSKYAVVELVRQADHNIIRRIAAWDAADVNTEIFGVHHSAYNLIEDVAGWGIARKIFSNSQSGNNITIRRAWGRWDGSHVVGPKMTYSLLYSNYRNVFENIIGTWSGRDMRETYVLDCGPGPHTYEACGKTFTNYAVDQPYGIFAMDAMKYGSHDARSKILGGIAYVKASDRFAAGRVLAIGWENSLELRDIVAYSQLNNKTTIFLTGPRQSGGPLIATNLTGIGGKGISVDSAWTQSNIRNLPAPPANGAIFTQHPGVCKRYLNGQLTNNPLWPWPMNQRIKDAMVQSGRPPVDVTAEIESMLGPIPAQCRGAGGR
jgi:hypothetical protein